MFIRSRHAGSSPSHISRGSAATDNLPPGSTVATTDADDSGASDDGATENGAMSQTKTKTTKTQTCVKGTLMMSEGFYVE